jgi:hypothetical protein
MKRTALALTLLATFSCAPLLGCDKIKGAMGKSDEGGVSTTSGGTSALSILNGFEGEIGVTVKGKSLKADKPLNLVLDVKADKLRVELPQGIEGAEQFGKVYGIFDSPAKKLFVVLDDKKQVIVIDLNKSGEELKGMKPSAPHHGGSGGPPQNPPKITKTGRTDKVAGYACEIWSIESQDAKEKGKAEVCIAEQGVSWFHIPMTGMPAEYAFMAELMDGKHFPLRMVMFNAANVEEGRVEITRIDKKTLDASVFVPPAAYQQMDIGQAIGAMMGGGMGPGMGRPGMPTGMPPGMGPGGKPGHGGSPFGARN